MADRVFMDGRRPVHTIIGGMMYEATPDLGVAFRHWQRRYSGENYAYFRLYDTVVEGRTYRSAVYTKMPVCIFQFADEAVGIRYAPVVGDQIPSVSVWSDGEGCHFEYTDSVSHLMRSKDNPHLGSWQRESAYKPEIARLPELARLSAPAWWQIVRQFVETELEDWQGALSAQQVQSSLSLAAAFHDRIFDAVNGVHLESVYPDRPERYGNAIFCHTSFEACRIMALLRYSSANRARCDRIARQLVFNETLSAELREIGPYRVWHNGFQTLKGDSTLYGCTIYGTGFSGYPGGMATLIRKLLEYAHTTGSADLLPRLRQGADWLILVQRQDGSFPFTVPTFADISSPSETSITGPESRALGGAAEAARALVWAFKVFGDEKYLSAAEKAVERINPTAPFYAFRGYGDLRDASEYETSATAGIQLAWANLDIHEATNKAEYLETAKALGYYVLTWHDWWKAPAIDPYGLIDPMADSFCPHVSPWNTALASELYSRIYSATGDPFWQKVAEFAFYRAASLQDPLTGGISEAYNLKWIDEITTMGAESGMTTWGLLDAGCALLANRGEQAVADDRETDARESFDGRFEIGAAVTLLIPARVIPGPTQILRRFRPQLKYLMKSIIGVKGPALMRKRAAIPTAPVSLAPKAGREQTVALQEPAGIEQVFSFQATRGGGTITVRLSALRHDPRVRKVCCPVIRFGCDVLSAEPAQMIGKTIRSCAVRLADGTRLEIEFLSGTTGLGVTGITRSGGSVLCDVTLKAGWQFGGECVQLFRMNRAN